MTIADFNIEIEDSSIPINYLTNETNNIMSRLENILPIVMLDNFYSIQMNEFANMITNYNIRYYKKIKCIFDMRRRGSKKKSAVII